MEVIDARGLRCPMPLLRARRFLATAAAGSVVQVWSTDLGAPADFTAYCAQAGHQLMSVEQAADSPAFFKITLVKSL